MIAKNFVLSSLLDCSFGFKITRVYGLKLLGHIYESIESSLASSDQAQNPGL